MRTRSFAALGGILASVVAATTAAAVDPPDGYIYSAQLLGNLTQSCVAAGPGGTFVGIGPGFTANAQSVVLAKESGETRLVVSGFNSIADCAYDAAADVLYVTDNADNADLMIASSFGAQSGDTIFAVPNASTASGVSAPGLELLPADYLPAAASVTVDASGNVFVSDSAGPVGLGAVFKIVGSTPSVHVPLLDYASGLAVHPTTGNLFVAQTLGTFQSVIDEYTPAGTSVPPSPLAGPSSDFGSYDLAVDGDGQLIATGDFFGDVVSIDPTTGTPTPFVSGFTFATGVTVDTFTRRVQLLSSVSPVTDEAKSLHRFTPIEYLTPGTGSETSECVQELYGLSSVDGKSAVCVDGAACDSDGAVNDRCVFPVGFCFNVDDPDFGDCAATNDVTAVEVSTKPYSASVADAVAALSLPLSGSTCVFTDGVLVPVKITGGGDKKDGIGKIKVKSETDAGQKDTDSVKLVCKPAP